MRRGRVRTSSIVIASGERTVVYRKLEEVPPPLRDKLVRSTSGANCATLLIADKEGARELLGRPAAAAPVARPRWLQYLLTNWAELALSGLLALLLCLLLAARY